MLGSEIGLDRIDDTKAPSGRECGMQSVFALDRGIGMRSEKTGSGTSLYICISQKNPFFFTQTCLLTNIETKVRYNTDDDGI
jgi:hypothetical protein